MYHIDDDTVGVTSVFEREEEKKKSEKNNANFFSFNDY